MRSSVRCLRAQQYLDIYTCLHVTRGVTIYTVQARTVYNLHHACTHVRVPKHLNSAPPPTDPADTTSGTVLQQVQGDPNSRVEACAEAEERTDTCCGLAA
jgi:hypothetical protein